ncbi:MAG: HNH endonuclease [Thermoguttaceae bacterium]
MAGRTWSREETLAAFNLYCRRPFGRLHAKNRAIVELAERLGRTAGSVAMKCCNFASLDPALQRRGIKGLRGASQLDRELWEAFQNSPEQIGFESELHYSRITGNPLQQAESVQWEDVEGLDRETVAKVRVNQHLFRSMILAAYGEACAICSLPVVRLLVAGHIVPWAMDRGERMNPCNGICLCCLHDRAYETGIVRIDEGCVVRLGEAAGPFHGNEAFANGFTAFEGRPIRLPERWRPDPALLRRRWEWAAERLRGKAGEMERE